MGIDMGFNAQHHLEEELPTVHVHADGNEHQHHTNGDKNHQFEINGLNSKDAKDNCCNDKVVKLTEADKAVPQSLNTSINPSFVTAFISSFYNIDVLDADLQILNIKCFVRSHHPPIPDIRLAIQSFLI